MSAVSIGNRYRLDAPLGQGGMGVVYRAHDLVLDRDVAVKMLSDSGLGSEGRARLLREAQSAARLNHPNIVTVYDAGENEGTPYIVMELVEGESLHARRPSALDTILSVAGQLCAALEHAHAHGIIHRDLKPENVLISNLQSLISVPPTSPPIAKLMDFGLARSAASRLTSSGMLVGTVFYLAPEQAMGQEIDGRADLYSLGVLLYELITGRLPFTADDPLAVISQHLYAPLVPPRTLRADLPPAVEAIIVKLLEKNPAARYASAREAGAALEAAAAQLHEADSPAIAAAPIELLQGLARGRLVGRRAEVEQLRELWRRAQQGHGHLALLSGEPGIGKTRLANEIQVYARLNGATVLRGGCYEYEAATPYLPFADALREWVRAQPDEALRLQAGPNAAELAKLAPEIESRLGPLTPNAPLPPAEERLRLFDHLVRFFRTLAGGRGLLLFIDDLHWADQGTLALLHYLLRNLRDERFLALAAYREVELDRSHPLAAALVEWNRERLATRLALGRFSVEDTGALLATLFGQGEVSGEFAGVIHRETEGNPFFVEEVIKSLIEQGQIYREENDWGRKEVAELAIPQSIKEAIGRRLNRLSPACIEALHAAAALGKVFSFEELAATLKATQREDQLLDALDEAGAAQLIQAGQAETFVFTHDKIREVLYEELNPIRRRRLHQRIGEALEGLQTAAPGQYVQDLAHHFILGGDLVKGIDYSFQAAQKADAVFVHEEAVKNYQQALEAAEALNLPEKQATLLEAMGDSELLQGTLQQTVALYERALALAASAEAQAVVKSKIGVAYCLAGDEKGLAYIQAALPGLSPATQPRALAAATGAIGRYYHYQSRHQKAIAYLEQARRLAETLDDVQALGRIYAFLSGAYQHLAQYDLSMEWARRCIELGQSKNYLPAQAWGYEFLAEDAVILGYWKDALENGRLDSRLGEETGQELSVAWGYYSQAHALLGLGRLAEAAGIARQSYSMAEAVGDKRLAVIAGTALGMILIDMGEADQAAPGVRLSYERAVELDQIYLVCEASLGLAQWHLQRGEWAAAVQLFEHCFAKAASTENRVGLLRICTYYPVALLGLGRLPEAERAADEALARARQAQSPYLEARARRVQGQIAVALGRPAEAAPAFDEAIAAFDSLESRPEQARALYQRGLLRQAQGDSVSAQADLRRAFDLFTACGARPEADQARQALGRLV